MKSSARVATLLVLNFLVMLCGCDTYQPVSPAPTAQMPETLGFQAQPRPIRYDLPLAEAVIVYGKASPAGKACAQKLADAISSRCGNKLRVLSDGDVVSDRTWQVSDRYRRTPAIVIGNAQDNRLMAALGLKYLDQSNHSWPGGDRYLVRTIFEPFAANANYIALSASTDAGMEGAIVAMTESLKKLPKDSTAIPFTRIFGGSKDKWQPANNANAAPKEFQNDGKTAAEIAAKAGVAPYMAGEPLGYAFGSPMTYGFGGYHDDQQNAFQPDDSNLKQIAAVFLNGIRAAGGRTHIPFHHYGGMAVLLNLRGLFQANVLTEKEFNEFESALVYSAAYPSEYYYDHIGSDSGFISAQGGRHCMACLVITTYTLDYVIHHCRMDDRTRKEVIRRHEGTLRACKRYIRSFRDNGDTWELGESTMMQLYATLYMGYPEVVKNGTLRHAADMYIFTTDNLKQLDYWQVPGIYAGLDTYIGASPGMAMASWHGRGLITAAAFYYDDPQYRWFIEQVNKQQHGCFSSVATRMYPMTWDPNGKMEYPTRYNGVHALPYDPRLYERAATEPNGMRWDERIRCRVPEFDKAADRVAFRDGFKPEDAYLFLCTSQVPQVPQNNAIARYTDLGELWLYSNTMKGTGYGRSVVSISNGKECMPVVGTTIEAIGNLGEVSAISSKESNSGGADWTRTILHVKGHYFLVIDKVQALAEDDFNMTCRWRSFNPATIENGVFTATAPSGAVMRIIPSEPLQQTSEYWECDGAARPTVLAQQKHAHLKKGEFVTFQNLVYVSGKDRPDEFQIKRVSDKAVMIKGKTVQGEYLAMVGIDGDCPLTQLETDAPIYFVSGDRVCLFGSTKRMVPSGMTLEGKPSVAEDRSGKAAWSVAGTLKGVPVAALLEGLWTKTKDATGEVIAAGADDGKLFEKIAVDKPLEQPLRRIRRVTITSEPKSTQPLPGLTDNQYSTCLAGYQPTWYNVDKLTVSFDFGKIENLACMRLVSIHKAAGVGDPEWGAPYNQPGDFTFSLEVSNDNFAKDIRKIEKPNVVWEETKLYPTWHYSLGRLPTWRIDINASARYVRLMPRPTTKERPTLSLSELEVYAADKAPDVSARAFAADVDGDGSNELVVGSSNKQVAVYGEDGKLRWTKNVPGDIFNMICGDLEADGKSEIVVYETKDETMHRFNGDSSERAAGNIKKALMDFHKSDNSGGLVTLAIWGPDGPDKKEVLGWSEGCFRVAHDGQTRMLKAGQPRGAGPLNNFYPGEPVALATIGWTLDIWSANRDADGNYKKLVARTASGPMGGPLVGGFGWIRQVSFAGHKGLLAANDGGLDYFPVEALALGGNTGLPDKIIAPVKGQWHFLTGGVPIVAATIDDTVAEDQVRIFIAREDGFVNVMDLNGKMLAVLNTGEPVLGMALLGATNNQPRRLAVVTKFGVHVYSADLKKQGSTAIKAAAFAGPGGKAKDRVYCVDDSGKVTVVVVK